MTHLFCQFNFFSMIADVTSDVQIYQQRDSFRHGLLKKKIILSHDIYFLSSY